MIKENVNDIFDDISMELTDYCTQLTEGVADEMLERIVRRTPVITGTLRDGWEVTSQSKSSFVISNDVEYAGYVEYGTEKMEPRAMVRTTLEEIDSIIQQVKGRL